MRITTAPPHHIHLLFGSSATGRGPSCFLRYSLLFHSFTFHMIAPHTYDTAVGTYDSHISEIPYGQTKDRALAPRIHYPLELVSSRLLVELAIARAIRSLFASALAGHVTAEGDDRTFRMGLWAVLVYSNKSHKREEEPSSISCTPSMTWWWMRERMVPAETWPSRW
jgi:hypothetical protein